MVSSISMRGVSPLNDSGHWRNHGEWPAPEFGVIA
jgi:hypothetical protein